MLKASSLFTSDALLNGRLVLTQEKHGYRFSVDALLLAGLTRVKPEDSVADLGTGCGVVVLVMAYRKLGREFIGLEIQAELAGLATRNVEANGLSDRVKIEHLDFRKSAERFPPGSFDLVVSNPPYRRLESGRVNLHAQRAMARHELLGSVADVFAAGGHILRHGGRLAVVYPAVRLGHLLVVAHRNGFSPKELTIVHSKPRSPACLVHLECRKGGGEQMRINPPFFVYDGNGVYSERMLRLMHDS